MADRPLLATLSPLLFMLASCGASPAGDNRPQGDAPAETPFETTELGRFEEPWAMAFDRGTGVLFVTEKKGRIKFVEPGGKLGLVQGVPKVDYGGQGGLGDFIFAPAEPSPTLDRRTVYLSWAEAGPGDTRGAAVGRADLVCEDHSSCALRNLKVIWRQTPKTTGRGHYSHRLAFSPDGQYLFIASGERQKQEPAQDLSNNLGTIVRLLPDGTPAPGNPFAELGGTSRQIWSYGHRNILGLAFDGDGRLWDVEHGARGGDELNLVKEGANYGWPVVSNGRHYDGTKIPHQSTRPEFAAPATSWDPVIAPGGMIFYRGDMFPEWKGQALIAAMKPGAIVRVAIDGEKAREVSRYHMDHRIRAIAEHEDGSIWVLEDGRNMSSSRLLKLTPRRKAN
ncbi:MAG: PQQ-dependent sugar dehydrogenase [Novosphingobium sp.]|nr:PQQ-dependent sugar dehydrogenase [Novosphingobium sp.]MCP5402769.1 PQQ-dependent sugar dehydrogenase [Novosphingobium sp.]